MFTFDPNLSTPRDRIRLNTGDIESPGYMADETIAALIVINTSTGTDADGNPTTTINEEGATRSVARALAAQYATKPTEISSPAGRLAWTARVDQWNKIAAGQATGTESSATGITLKRGPRRDYSPGAGDQ